MLQCFFIFSYYTEIQHTKFLYTIQHNTSSMLYRNSFIVSSKIKETNNYFLGSSSNNISRTVLNAKSQPVSCFQVHTNIFCNQCSIMFFKHNAQHRFFGELQQILTTFNTVGRMPFYALLYN